MTEEPITRECVHQRRINLEGYVRSDGLMDIEGEIIDMKGYDFPNQYRGIVKTGEALHHMKVKITVDDDMTIVDAEAETLAGPFAICPSATIAFANMIGVQIGPGWRRKVRQAIGGITGCTHITELMGSVGPVAFQAVFGEKARKRREMGIDEDKGRDGNSLADSCIGHAIDEDAALALAEEKRKNAQ
jgi:hypothetical protein